MLAPEAAPEARLKVRLFAGKSASLAKFDTTIKLPAWTVRLAIAASIGAEFVAVAEFVVAGCELLPFVTEMSVSARLFDETRSGVLLVVSARLVNVFAAMAAAWMLTLAVADRKSVV